MASEEPREVASPSAAAVTSEVAPTDTAIKASEDAPKMVLPEAAPVAAVASPPAAPEVSAATESVVAAAAPDATEDAPTETKETTATTPATPMSKSKRQSVANAAMLFSGGDSDPFANLIGAIGEEEEGEEEEDKEEKQIGAQARQQAATSAPRAPSMEDVMVGAADTATTDYDWPPSHEENLFESADQADPYAAHLQQPQGGDRYAQPDPYAQPDLYAQQPDPYAQQPDPYAQQPDPYAQQIDSYATSQQDAYQYGHHAEQPQHDPYAVPPNDPYAAHQHDPYATQQHDPYATQEYDPYTTQQIDPYATQQHDPYGVQHHDQNAAEQIDPYAVQQHDPYGAPPEHDPYGEHQQHGVEGASSQYDPLGTQQIDAYAAPPQDPYGMPQQVDSYGVQQQHDPYGEEQQADPYGVQQQTDPYGVHQQHDPYSAHQRAAEDVPPQHGSYDEQQSDPYAKQQHDSYVAGPVNSYAAPQHDSYEAQQHDPYAVLQHDAEGAPSPQHESYDAQPTDPYAPKQTDAEGSEQQSDPYGALQQNEQDGAYEDSMYVAQQQHGSEGGQQKYGSYTQSLGADEASQRYDQADMHEEQDPYGAIQHHEYNAGRDQDPGGVRDQHDPYSVQQHDTYSALNQRDVYGVQQHDEYGATPETDPYGASQQNGQYAAQEHSGPQQHPGPDRSAHVPLICFSIDGKFVTHFPSAGVNSAANDSAAYGMGLTGSSTQVTIRSLSGELPSTTYATCMKPLQFPGPLFEMPSGSALSRGTPATSSSSKAKKATLIKHLSDAATELSSGIGYLHANQSPESKRIEDRVCLVRILSLALEHDGNMQSNAAFDKAVVEMLLGAESGEESSLAVQQDMSRVPSSATSSDGGAAKAETSVAGGSPSGAYPSLDHLQYLLAHGKRSEAVEFAKNKKLWTHAVIIASGMDKETWRDVVSAFIEAELDDGGHQSLKVAYSVFSGQEARSLYDLFRPKQVIAPSSEAIPRSTSHDWRRAVAMIIANRTPPAGGSASGSGGESANLTAIGDGLLLAGWLEAAHVCYLLSPSTSGLDGHDTGSARLTLLGAQNPAASTSYLRDLDAIMLTEVWEFALSLRPVPKGSEAYQGLPYLQAYRIVHAYYLAEMGEHKKALRYCDAITSVLKTGKMNRHYHTVLLQQLQELSFRLSGGDGSKGGSQIGAAGWARKKPTMDGVWGALENRFTKFIAGEDEGTTAASKASSVAGGVGKGGPGGASQAAVGAFTHYSAITPEATSRDVSRTQSYADFSGGSGSYTPVPAHPPSNSSGTSFSRPVSRASSTFEGRPVVSPLSNVNNLRLTQPYSEWPTSAGPAHSAGRGNDGGLTPPPPGMRDFGNSSDTDAYGGPYTTHATRNAPWYASSNGGPGGHSYDGSAGGEGYEVGERAGADDTVAPGRGDGSYYGYDSHGASKPQFVSNIDQDLSDALDVEGFVSPMDALGGAPTPTFSYAPPAEQRNDQDNRNDTFGDDDDDDLGLGNSRGKPRRDANRDDDDEEGSGEAKTPTPAAAAHAQRDSNASASSSSTGGGGELRQTSSWFGRFWSRGGTPNNEPKAVRAHLGEEVSFYFDKDLKRWVNKKAGGDDASQASAAPPPPPQRAATASPSMGRGAPPRSFSGGPPMQGGGPPSAREAQRAVSSSALSFGGIRSAGMISETVEEMADEGGAEDDGDGHGRQQAPPPPMAGRQPISRPRSNLADHSQPPAMQAPSSSETGGAGLSAMPPRPPPTTTGSGFKKKPISKRYVRVD